MAKNTVRREDENSVIVANVVKIQKAINSDYVKLANDYKKLFVEIWNIPATKFILSGLAAGTVLPYAFKGVSWLKGSVTEKIEDRRLQSKIEDLKNHFGHVGDEIPKS